MSLFLRTARIFSVKLFTILFPVLVAPALFGFFVLLGTLDLSQLPRIPDTHGLLSTPGLWFAVAFVFGGVTRIVAGIVSGAVWGLVALWNSAKSEAARIPD